MNFDSPFEENFVALLEARKQYIIANKKEEPVVDETAEDNKRLPFDIYKTNQCLVSNDIKRKGLKNVSPE